MIRFTLMNGYGELDLSTLKGWGILWEHNDPNLSFTNSYLKIPGGKIFDIGSEKGDLSYAVSIVSNDVSKARAYSMYSRIASTFLDPTGKPVSVKMYKHYEPGFRIVKLKDMNINFGKDWVQIDMNFDLRDQNIYSDPITETYNTAEVRETDPGEWPYRDSSSAYVGVDMVFKFKADSNMTDVKVHTVLGNTDKPVYYVIKLPDLKAGDTVVIDTSTYKVTKNGVDVFVHIPKDFKLYNRVYVTAATGSTVSNISVTYSEVYI